ncbi:MAG: hypothetical protein ACR2OU_11190 [Thermomicrobiales bacterium]
MNLPHPHPQPTPPSELIVVGEHRSDPLRLLLLGVDGNYYAYALPEGNPKPIELDDGWVVESPSTHDLFDESASMEGYDNGTHHEDSADF